MLGFAVGSLTPLELPGVAIVDLDTLAGLPPSLGTEIDEANAMADQAASRRFLARRAAIRLIASSLTGMPPHKVSIRRADDGLLFFEPDLAGLSVSGSSRGNLCAIGVAHSPIGVDLEVLGQLREIPWNVLHKEEQAELKSVEPERQERAFLRLWTAKEAHLKAQGVGLAREPSSFIVRGFSDIEPWRLAVDDPDGPVDDLTIACKEARLDGRNVVVTAVVIKPV